MKTSIMRNAIMALALAAGMTFLNARTVTLGLRTMYAPEGQAIWMPVYLSNYSPDFMNSFGFIVNFDHTVVVVDTVVRGRDMSADWVLDFVRVNQNSAQVLISVINGKGLGENTEAELVRLQFGVGAGVPVSSSSSVTLSDIQVNFQKVVDSDWATPGAIHVSAAWDSLGDVDGNGEVDPNDAMSINQCSAGTNVVSYAQTCDPSGKRSDVSGDQKVNSYDALLVSQYVLGLVADFPARNNINWSNENTVLEYANTPANAYEELPPTETSAYRSAPIALSGPTAAGPDLYEYVVIAATALGIMAADIELTCNPDIIKGIKSLDSDLKSVNRSGRFNADRTTYTISLFSNIRETRAAVALVKIVAIHATGATVSGFAFNKITAYTLPPANPTPAGTVPNTADSSGKQYDIMPTPVLAQARALAPAEVDFSASRSAVILRKAGLAPATIELCDLGGRVVRTANMGADQHSIDIDISSFPAGRYIAIMSAGAVRMHRCFSLQR